MCNEQELYDFDLEDDSNPFGELDEDEKELFREISNDHFRDDSVGTFIKTDKELLIEKILEHSPVILEKEQLQKLSFSVLAEIMETM